MTAGAEWTPAEIAAAREVMAATEARGVCPYSGYSIAFCYSTDLCDCAYAPPMTCTECPVVCWDVDDHRDRYHL